MRPREEITLDTKIEVRLAAKQKARIETLAEAHDLTVSEYVRRKALGHKIAQKTDLKVLRDVFLARSTLLKMGGLFKHLYSTNPVYSDQTAQALEEVLKLFPRVDILFRKIEDEVEGGWHYNDDAEEIMMGIRKILNGKKILPREDQH